MLNKSSKLILITLILLTFLAASSFVIVYLKNSIQGDARVFTGNV